MAVLLTMDIAIDRKHLEAVSAAIGVHDDPPEGLIVHLLTDTSDGVHVADVWESQADFQKFNDERLLPAMQRVLSERGVPLDGPLPAPTFDEAYDLVRGR